MAVVSLFCVLSLFFLRVRLYSLLSDCNLYINQAMDRPNKLEASVTGLHFLFPKSYMLVRIVSGRLHPHGTGPGSCNMRIVLDSHVV